MITACHVQEGENKLSRVRAKWNGKWLINYATCQALSMFSVGIHS